MGFCYNCGTRIGDGDCYCPECGVRLIEQEEQLMSGMSKDSMSQVNIEYGYLFTNMSALSMKLNVSSDSVLSVLEWYIAKRKQQGIYYSIIDVSSYQPRLSVNKVPGGYYKLSPSDGWEVHQRLLTDCYTYDVEKCQKPVKYLFIIGADDVVPTPVIDLSSKNMEQFEDVSLETDLPYCYLYGKRTVAMINDNSFLRISQMLLVARLPLAIDTDFQMFQNYFQRAADAASNGIDFKGIYGQCNQCWKKVSALVTGNFYDSGLMPDYQYDNPNFIYRSLWITPYVTSANINQVFWPKASFYYFNMHGSSVPGHSAFTGELVDENGNKNFYVGIRPQDMANTLEPNVVMTEACFGAHYNGRPISDSMLLSSIWTKSLIYVGSSVSAYGSVDGSGAACVSLADIIAKVFMEAMLKGYTAAEALFLARRTVAKENRMSLYCTLTIAEFNLFGDPSLRLSSGSMEEKSVGCVDRILNSSQTKVEVSVVYDEKRVSILDKVRQAVNRNLLDIVNILNEHLYSNYNIKPRKLEKVIVVTSSAKKLFYYQYQDESNAMVYVEVDDNRNINKVITSK